MQFSVGLLRTAAYNSHSSWSLLQVIEAVDFAAQNNMPFVSVLGEADTVPTRDDISGCVIVPQGYGGKNVSALRMAMTFPGAQLAAGGAGTSGASTNLRTIITIGVIKFETDTCDIVEWESKCDCLSAAKHSVCKHTLTLQAVLALLKPAYLQARHRAGAMGGQGPSAPPSSSGAPGAAAAPPTSSPTEAEEHARITAYLRRLMEAAEPHRCCHNWLNHYERLDEDERQRLEAARASHGACLSAATSARLCAVWCTRPRRAVPSHWYLLLSSTRSV